MLDVKRTLEQFLVGKVYEYLKLIDRPQLGKLGTKKEMILDFVEFLKKEAQKHVEKRT